MSKKEVRKKRQIDKNKFRIKGPGLKVRLPKAPPII